MSMVASSSLSAQNNDNDNDNDNNKNEKNKTNRSIVFDTDNGYVSGGFSTQLL